MHKDKLNRAIELEKTIGALKNAIHDCESENSARVIMPFGRSGHNFMQYKYVRSEDDIRIFNDLRIVEQVLFDAYVSAAKDALRRLEEEFERL